MSRRETILNDRMSKEKHKWSANSRPLSPLKVADHVWVQNQQGNHKRRWDHSGVITSRGDFDQYWIRMDLSGRTTKRNRQFLRLRTMGRPPSTPNVLPTPIPYPAVSRMPAIPIAADPSPLISSPAIPPLQAPAPTPSPEPDSKCRYPSTSDVFQDYTCPRLAQGL